VTSRSNLGPSRDRLPPLASRVWRTIPFALGYEVSNDGWVRNAQTGRLLSRWDTAGYHRVTLQCGAKHANFLVHDVMLTTFDRPRLPHEQCRHLNGRRTDNRWPENLAWGTPLENGQDRVSHGTTPLTDMTGQRFGRLTVVERAAGAKNASWRCRCDCGAERVSRGNLLRRGAYAECIGCERAKRTVFVETCVDSTENEAAGG
jgi:hypothetical protein